MLRIIRTIVVFANKAAEWFSKAHTIIYEQCVVKSKTLFLTFAVKAVDNDSHYNFFSSPLTHSKHFLLAFIILLPRPLTTSIPRGYCRLELGHRLSAFIQCSVTPHSAFDVHPISLLPTSRRSLHMCTYIKRWLERVIFFSFSLATHLLKGAWFFCL